MQVLIVHSRNKYFLQLQNHSQTTHRANDEQCSFFSRKRKLSRGIRVGSDLVIPLRVVLLGAYLLDNTRGIVSIKFFTRRSRRDVEIRQQYYIVVLMKGFKHETGVYLEYGWMKRTDQTLIKHHKNQKTIYRQSLTEAKERIQKVVYKLLLKRSVSSINKGI